VIGERSKVIGDWRAGFHCVQLVHFCATFENEHAGALSSGRSSRLNSSLEMGR
jgi:hypothetical protein